MPTLLDELVVRLGLDGAAFQGQVQTTQSSLTKMGATARREASSLEEYLKKTQAETGRRMKQTEEVGRQVGQQFNNVKNNVLGLFATMAGAYGMQQFFKSIVSGDASLGYFSKTLGISIETMGTWIEMGKRAGASADTMKSTFARLSEIKQEYLLHGMSATNPIWQQGFGIDPVGKTETELLKELSTFAKKHENNPAQTRALLQGLGISPEMLPLLLKGREELEKMEIALRALGVATAKSAEEDQKFIAQLSEVEQIIRDIGRTIFSDLQPPLMEALKAFKAWVLANREWISTKIRDAIRETVPIIKEIASAIEKVVEFLGGWKTTSEIIFGLWAASKVAPILEFLVTFTKLIWGANTAAEALAVAMGGLAVPAWFATFMRFLPALAALGLIGPAGGEDPEFSNKMNDKYLRDKYGDDYKTNPEYLRLHTGGATDERKASIRDRLAGDKRLGITSDAASGLVSNLNAESGIRGINEANNGPGFGWAQWTDTQGSPRRTNFMNFTKERGLDPTSDDANYEFLVDELKNKYPNVLAQLRRGSITASEAANIVARGYIVPPSDKIPGHVADAGHVAGLPRTVPNVGPVFGPQTLPPPAAAVGATHTDNSKTSSVETHINGPIQVQTSATDADGIAKGIGQALRRYAYVPQVNTGLA